MKSILSILLIGSALFAQDILTDKNGTYPGKVVAIDSSHIAFMLIDNEKIIVAQHKAIRQVVLESGETIIDENRLKIGQEHRLWSNETRYLSGKFNRSSVGTTSDTLKTTFASKKKNLDNQERSTKALERIALVLTIYLGLTIGGLIVALLA
ncbi:MAG: hypothetical protein HON27_12100 [Candidatus Marinimicrobia bacterium]|nr:hypothetical protein [Candidatus Neomarinimicrobiota bacterium]MBT4946900.1 hypothetical protein [Candidatus Neomarinimicrobiota bacterium]MBT5270117.1 hypothetical protein [Candidatus Neomarinimicrobiota bacterium]MBT6012267.1 hypothetical protein [Candidatus Neomarinimicrobiota bacterium]